MPQLYAQMASRPDPWLIGRTSAGLCTLQTACPLTVTYSGGASDTIAAATGATVYGGSAVAFDVSADVWVVLTVQGSGALQVVKEADLATVAGDWAGLARIVQHTIDPYQPSAYLASGGLGGTAGTPSTSTVLTSSTAAKALSLWSGGSNVAPPSGWETSAFDDSAWSAAHVATITPTSPASTGVAGTVLIWASATPASATERILVRQHFSVPAGLPSSATIQLGWDDYLDAIYVNGTALSGVPTTQDNDWGGATSLAIPAPDLIAGADNVLAIVMRNAAPNNAWLSYALAVTMGGARGAGTAREGDILYYHSGQWIDLPIGTTGQELTVVAGDPAWATPAASGVTSVQVAVPAPLSASGGPVTSSGTITLAWASGQTANRVLATPDGTTGTVGLRALVGNDIPVDASTIVVSAGTITGNYQAGSGVSISGNTISATGSGGSVTSVALSAPALFSVAGSPITSSGTLALTYASGQKLPTAQGGTGIDGSSAANGALLIGNGSGYSLATLTAGSGVTVTNGSGTVTIAASGGSGTVTSITLSMPGIFSVSPATITTSGTFSVSLATQSAATVFAGPASGSAAAPTFRALQGSDLPPAAAAGGHIHAHGHFL